jgi:hypothetical protein
MVYYASLGSVSLPAGLGRLGQRDAIRSIRGDLRQIGFLRGNGYLPSVAKAAALPWLQEYASVVTHGNVAGWGRLAREQIAETSRGTVRTYPRDGKTGSGCFSPSCP